MYLGIISACLLTLCLAQQAVEVGEEKQWMPWPSSLKDPKKEYMTITLPEITETERFTSTHTHHITKTVYSHITEFPTIFLDKSLTTTLTETINSTLTKTISSTIIERVSHTTKVTETSTLHITSTIQGQDAEGKFQPLGVKILHHTNTITTRPTVIVPFIKTIKSFTRKTLFNTSTSTVTAWKTTSQVSIESITVTSSSRIFIKETIKTTVTIE